MIKYKSPFGITSKFSLKVSLAVYIFLGAVIAFLTFTVVRFSINQAINKIYLDEENKRAREENYIADFQNYIERNSISSDDTAKFSEWVKAKKYVYMLIYKDDELFYSSDIDYDESNPEDVPENDDVGDSDSTDADTRPSDEDERQESGGNQGGITVDLPTYEELKEYAKKNNLHAIQLEDGTVFASITEFSEYLYYDLANMASIAAAVLAFALLIVIFFVRIVSKISKLAVDVNRVLGGDMDYAIESYGNDELALLSRDVEKMRSTIIYNLNKEREARAANEELITSMSHDIRTPLTVLLGYLDVMKSVCTDEQMSEYIKASESTAMRLKKLSDDMFNYFLVFGSRDAGVEMQEYEAQPLFEQLLSEHILLLKEMGYTVNVESHQMENLSIITDAPNTMRIMDNLFSNLTKYSDISSPINIIIRSNGGIVELVMENTVKSDSSDVESNGIGLKTCKKLSDMLSAEFRYEHTGDKFRVCMGFPVYDGKERS